MQNLAEQSRVKQMTCIPTNLICMPNRNIQRQRRVASISCTHLTRATQSIALGHTQPFHHKARA